MSHVDGSGLSSPEREQAIVASLNLSHEGLVTLAAELRNALVPAQAAAMDGNAAKALPGIERVLALAAALASAARTIE